MVYVNISISKQNRFESWGLLNSNQLHQLHHICHTIPLVGNDWYWVILWVLNYDDDELYIKSPSAAHDIVAWFLTSTMIDI
jgi:hypothetical protein